MTIKKFRNLEIEEKEDFIFSILLLKTNIMKKTKKVTTKELTKVAESNLHIKISPSTLGKILRIGSYQAYLLDRIGLDERFRKEYDSKEIVVLGLIPSTPNPRMSHLYDAREKGIPTEKAKMIIEKLEYDGLIKQILESRDYPYFNYVKTKLGKKLINAIRRNKYKLNLSRNKYAQEIKISS